MKLVWGHKPHIAQVPFYPLDLKHHGQPSVKYGIADSKKKEPEDALVRIDGGIIVSMPAVFLVHTYMMNYLCRVYGSLTAIFLHKVSPGTHIAYYLT